MEPACLTWCFWRPSFLLHRFFFRHDGRLDVGQVGGLHAFDFTTEAEAAGIVGSYEIDFGIGLDVLFHTGGPVDAIKNEAAVVGVEDVLRGPLSGVEDAGFFAGLGFVFARPGGGAGLFGPISRGILGHAIERLAFSEDGEGVIGDANIGTCHSEGVVSDSGEDDVALLRGKNLNAGGLLVVSAVVSNPSVSEDLVAEAFLEFLALILEAVVGVFFACRDFEGVGGCPESNDGTAPIDVVCDVFHLVIGEIEEAGEDDHEIGCLEGFETVDVGGTGFDKPLLINSEANGGFETVVLGEDTGKSGAGFLGAILVVRGDEDDVLSFAGAGRSFVNDWICQRD